MLRMVTVKRYMALFLWTLMHQRTIVKYLLISVLLLLTVHNIHAQYSDSVHYYAGAAATGTYNQTNTSSSYLFNNGVKFGIRKKSISLNSTNTWMYGEQQKTVTNNDVVATLDFNVYKLFPHAYYWGFANYTSSVSLKINNQYQAGAGIAYNIIDKKNTVLNVSDGLIYEQSDIYLSDTVRDIYNTVRNSFRLMFRWQSGIFSVNGTGFIQNSLETQSDYIVRVNTGAAIKVNKWLSFTVAYTYNRFNRTAKENTLFTYGLTIDKYF